MNLTIHVPAFGCEESDVLGLGAEGLEEGTYLCSQAIQGGMVPSLLRCLVSMLVCKIGFIGKGTVVRSTRVLVSLRSREKRAMMSPRTVSRSQTYSSRVGAETSRRRAVFQRKEGSAFRLLFSNKRKLVYCAIEKVSKLENKSCKSRFSSGGRGAVPLHPGSRLFWRQI